MTTYNRDHKNYYNNNKAEISKKHTLYVNKRREQDPLFKRYHNLNVYKCRTKKAIRIAIDNNDIANHDILLDKLNDIENELIKIKKDLHSNKQCKDV